MLRSIARKAGGKLRIAVDVTWLGPYETGAQVLTTAAINALADGNPATNPDWTSVIASISACVGLLFARDNKVTSEQVAAK